MSDLWIPGFEKKTFWGKTGGKYDRLDPKKCMIHMTQGSSVEGALAAYSKYPPHCIVDWKKKRRIQHIPLNRCSYSLKGSESDDEPVIQIEIVGYSDVTPGMPRAELDWLAEFVFNPIQDLWPYLSIGPPQGFHGANEGIYPYIASSRSPIRFTNAEFENFGGILGHQHAPAPDTHWDPGAFPIDKLIAHMNAHRNVTEEAMTPAEAKTLFDMDARIKALEVENSLMAAIIDRTTSPYEQVIAAYNSLLGRMPDDTGFKYWVELIRSGEQSFRSLGKAIMNTAEYQNRKR